MKNILILIDVQNGFVLKGTNDRALCRINELVRGGVFDCIIASVYRNYEGSPISKFMGWNEMKTEAEQQLAGDIKEHVNHIIYKTVYSAFSDSLNKIIRNENGGEIPSHVFIAGMDTDCCVLATASDFFEKGIRPVVLTHYCGSSGGEEAHIAGLRCLESFLGKNNLYNGSVSSVESLNDALRKAESV